MTITLTLTQLDDRRTLPAVLERWLVEHGRTEDAAKLREGPPARDATEWLSRLPEDVRLEVQP
jgi:hypothetical protein